MTDLRSIRAPLAVVALAAWLRILFNDVTSFSRADETQYLLLTQRLVQRGFFSEYAAIAREHVATQSAWVFPSPLRYGHFALTTTACHLAGECTYGTLAWLSTLAGVTAVAFCWLLGREFVGRVEATVGATLMALSPLQLGLSRRALQDEEMCALALAALWTFVKLLRERKGPRRELGWALATCALVTAAMAVKPSVVSYAPGFIALWLTSLRGRGVRRFDLVPLLAPVLYAAGYSLLAGGTHAFLDMVHVELGALDQSYSQQFQAGTANRYLVDLVALCPVSTLGAIGALALLVSGVSGQRTPATAETRGARQLAWLFGATFVTLSLATAKTARFAVGLDALACLLAGWFVVRLASRGSRSRAWLWGAVVIAGAIDLGLFQRVFVTRAVYDPTTDGVLRALDMLPR